ncbi:CLUMA_CG005489, isoform A [Clunio marinus]|uniref:CLUMA_CG005489, isoform A n=1 Tax=Clunio marinus TaxID=568069 RepID=A0A1J1HWY7_9DIPT|nr:CLUMA_CG005489, isoform A [Clunio marinus]
MTKLIELNSPTDTVMELVQSPNGSIPPAEEKHERVQMKKQLGLLEGCAIILGIIFGSGIFVSPKGVIQEVNSPGASLIIWTLCGALSMIGALCYAELGTCIPKSGGDYAYIKEAFGDLPSFLYIWDATVIFVPATNAIMSLTFASYVMQPFFAAECEVPKIAVQLLAAATICGLTYLNSFDVRTTTKLQNVIMFTKIGALVIIILVGLGWMLSGHLENFDHPFDNTEYDPGKISVAFYSGIFSYAGWNYLNFMTEELRDPYKNLPRAIYISLPLVTGIYVLANVAYLAVLTPQEMIASNAIAVTFGDKVLTYGAWIIPIMVAISAFGGLSVHIMTSSRMCFVAARNRHMPEVLSFINVKHFTPTPSLVFLCVLSLIYLFIGDVYVLITYSSVVETFFIMMSVCGVLYFRWKQPNMVRPIKVNLIVPITFVFICIFLIIVPTYQVPKECGMGLLITCAGIPFYYVCVAWHNKPKSLQNRINQFTMSMQKLFLSAKEEQDME